jgi:hypothetical protein
MIYDKKLLAIVKSLETWKSEFIEIEKEIKVMTNHRTLKYFMTTKELNCRQIRWAEMLSEFGFKITYRPGKKGGKPDAFTRRPQDLLTGVEDVRNEYQHQVLLKVNQLNDKINRTYVSVS